MKIFVILSILLTIITGTNFIIQDNSMETCQTRYSYDVCYDLIN